jgi:hypothetical protein
VDAVGPLPWNRPLSGSSSGEFDRVPEANDAFLDMVGYSREDLTAGRMVWTDLTPPEYTALDETGPRRGPTVRSLHAI